MAIKAVSWDVYGTLLVGRDETRDDEIEGEPIIFAREHSLETLEGIRSRRIIQVTSSDGEYAQLACNLREAGIPREIFEDFYKMDFGLPKDYSFILRDYSLAPRELLVVDDNEELGVKPALDQGCLAICVPEFFDARSQNWDLRKVLEFIDKENAKR